MLNYIAVRPELQGDSGESVVGVGLKNGNKMHEDCIFFVHHHHYSGEID